MYTIIIEQLICSGIHGVFVSEHNTAQRFQLDIRVTLPCLPPDDDFMKAVDYGKIKDIAEEVIIGERKNLLETLALQIRDGIRMTYPQVCKIHVEIRKLDIFPNAVVGVSLTS